ncbi:MAG: tRNA lysidine(34) synthetase TilS [Planctomycetota bacterium]
MTREPDHARATRWMRGVRASWRELTGGTGVADELRPTLIAVSGGADSAAVAIALATLDAARVVIGTVLHDQRPAELVHDDRVAVEGLARVLGVPCCVAHAGTAVGNAEHKARASRYRALERMARGHGCSFVATGHHAWDQAETLLMAIVRGGSPRSLLGVRRSRPMDGLGATVVRPALELEPSGASDVCNAFGYTPRRDATNLDWSRSRARLRRLVVPELAATTKDLGSMLRRTTERLAEAIDASVSEKRTNVGNNGVEPSDIADGIETEH